jgi:hypothetical protein
MIKYAIIRTTTNSQITADRIIGTIEARDRQQAQRYILEGHQAYRYNTLLPSEQVVADQAPIFTVNSNPKTATNPLGAGYPKRSEVSIKITLTLGLSQVDADWFNGLPNRSRVVSGLITNSRTNQSNMLTN